MGIIETDIFTSPGQNTEKTGIRFIRTGEILYNMIISIKIDIIVTGWVQWIPIRYRLHINISSQLEINHLSFHQSLTHILNLYHIHNEIGLVHCSITFFKKPACSVTLVSVIYVCVSIRRNTAIGIHRIKIRA